MRCNVAKLALALGAYLLPAYLPPDCLPAYLLLPQSNKSRLVSEIGNPFE